ncbi:MAG: DNA polymerase III subunit gamma/tau [Firmicutes bacterium]|nr:DNA polymerase III subunit gamma/tau [Bacillota bacterium]
MYTALYRRYRPRTFDEMVGQEHIVKILKKQIRTGEIAHAYLFCGTRGTGKTSAARIFAKGVNCLSEGERPCGHCDNCESIQHGTFFDVIEIDAASNNRVENIRELRESVKYPPAAGRCKVYIIDEVHMLSTAAFNALLKTLEEPPEQVVFILATTEPHKLPATILSRCLRLDFRRVPEMKIREKLCSVCEELGVAYEESALSLIAANGDGSVRDALSILEQCIPAGEKELLRSDVVEILGTAGEEVLLEITDMLVARDIPGVLRTIERISADGKDILQFTRDWIYHFRNLMMSRFAERLEDIFNMSCENAEKVKAQGARMDMGLISAAIHELSAAANQARYSTQPRVLLELAVVKLMEPALNDDREALVQRITRLEELAEKGNLQKTDIGFADGYKQDNNSTILYNNINNNNNVETELPDEQPAAETAPEDLPPWDQPPSEELMQAPYLPEEEFPEVTPEEPSAGKAPEAQEEPVSREESQSEEPAVEEAAAPKEDSGKKELQQIWQQAFEKAVARRASLKLLEKDIRALGEDADSFTVSVTSTLKKNMLLQSADLFEESLEEVTGRKLKLKAELAARPQDREKQMKDTLSQLEDLLGPGKLTVKD